MTTLGIGSGALVAGLLGMNLKNFMEDWAYGFPAVSSLAFGVTLLVFAYGWTRLKRIQKLTLYGRYPGTGLMSPQMNGLMPYDEEHLERIKAWKAQWSGDWKADYVDDTRKRLKWWKRMLKLKRYRYG